jgi:hypothetical protein
VHAVGLKHACDLNINASKTIILTPVSYGREIWCLTLRKGHRLRVKMTAFWDTAAFSLVK